VDAIVEPERGRAAYAKGAWSEAFESLSSADRAAPLDACDLELLARAAYMLGRDDDYVGGLERAHHAKLQIPREVIDADLLVLVVVALITVPVLLSGHRISRLEGGASSRRISAI
jgi:hypothetical protein